MFYPEATVCNNLEIHCTRLDPWHTKASVHDVTTISGSAIGSPEKSLWGILLTHDGREHSAIMFKLLPSTIRHALTLGYFQYKLCDCITDTMLILQYTNANLNNSEALFPPRCLDGNSARRLPMHIIHMRSNSADTAASAEAVAVAARRCIGVSRRTTASGSYSGARAARRHSTPRC